ncbi:MAG: hypothetical protein KC431_27165, partial [Myxococcales bacterium]|nr:hypothetical protein [Myxococcales bacterium]
ADAVELDIDVVCSSVVGSSGSPRLAYANEEGQVWIADLEQLQTWLTEDDEFFWSESDPQARQRWDELWIDHDGVFTVHDLIYEDMPPDVDSTWMVGIGTHLLYGATLLRDYADPHGRVQAPMRHAPLILRGGGELSAFAGSLFNDYPGIYRDLVTDSAGRSLMIDDDKGWLLRLSQTGEVLETLMSVEAFSMVAAPGGEWAAVQTRADGCLLDGLGECQWTLSAIERWYENESDEGGGGIGMPVGHFELLTVNDAGDVLALGHEFEAGPTPDPLPPDELLLYSDDLTPIASWPTQGYSFVRTRLTLADGRMLIELHDEGVGYLLLADPDAGTIAPVPGSANVEHNGVWLSADQRVLVFEDFDAEGNPRVLAGLF